MSVHSKPYFWLTCDHEGCDARSPSDGYEINAWSDESDAFDAASGDDWTCNPGGQDFCADHRPGDEEF